ncbi:serine/threonine protein kinase with PASTA sensor(s) [Janibacter hoylei PVAS-1]|uniref:non-specific serine/threonine protein kinase n=1 Tax=Janibacter hoylei PVAS-1 TaxID=1210046 RepID=K1DUD8_9MICO|nr:Stk1 family PASTA domain-containing Ser/Thr kinase [Janibacter hoylei]EKA60029.1 serine/threonine protein kinase with PASTA sensor(s) [Janibacter hoylei PVAS-1]RWU83989.1 serine/threonine-protein kinase [Janibacter hoylei PVAS-1]
MSAAAPRLLGGRYEVGELIGRGGMAEVHLGHDTRLGRPVAIKILRTDHARDAAFLGRFRREAQSVAGLNHRSIVAVYDSGEDRVVEAGGAHLDIPYIVMEYVDGRTLRELLNESETGTLEPTEAARIVQQVLEALDYSHDMGIVHRDIKPGNVMIADDGAVKVMDFGIARAIADTQATMTQTQAVIGTAQYISPEQARGETVDKRSDVYSTGCLLFELLTGRTPYTGEPISLTYQHVNADIPLPSSVNPQVPPQLDAIVHHALTKDRDERYPDAKSMAEDLEAYRGGRPISPVATERLDAATTALPVVAPRGEPTPRTDPETASMPVAQQRRRGGGLGWLMAALLLIPIALLGWFAWDASQGEEVVQVTVPKVVGSDEDAAVAKLESVGLKADVETVTDDGAVGTVIAQDPGEGTSVPEGDTVVIQVSGGPDEVGVPSVVGMGRNEATKALQDAGLEVGEITEEDSPDQGPNRVISSSPGPAESVAKGSKVDLVIASGDVDLQDYTGQKIDDVRSDLFGLKLKIKETTRESDEDEGTILEQSPGEGKIRQGRTVTFVVARKPAETVTTTPSSSETSDEPSDSESSEPNPTSTSPSAPLTPTPSEPSSTRSTSSTTQSPASP